MSEREGDSGEGMSIATSEVKCQRLQEVPVGVQALPITEVVTAAFVPVTQPPQDLQRRQTLRDQRPGLRGHIVGLMGNCCHSGG